MRWFKDARRPPGGYWRCRVDAAMRQRAYYEANRKKVLAKARRYREANPEKIRETCRRWRERNPEKKRESNQQRLKVSGLYLGMVGFTDRERKAMLEWRD